MLGVTAELSATAVPEGLSEGSCKLWLHLLKGKRFIWRLNSYGRMNEIALRSRQISSERRTRTRVDSREQVKASFIHSKHALNNHFVPGPVLSSEITVVKWRVSPIPAFLGLTA